HSFEAPLQEAADRLAVVTNQRRNQEETYAARDDRQDYEQAEIVAREPARNGDELVGDRRHALQEDDPRAPGGVQVAELLNALAIAIGLDDPFAEAVIKQRADGIARHAAHHRRRRAPKRERERALALREHHRH